MQEDGSIIEKNEQLNKPKRSIGNKIKLVISTLLLLFFVGVFAFSLYKIIIWEKDNKKTQSVTNEIISEAEVVIKADESLSINFDKLLEKNKRVVGWIMVKNTNVNYPILQYSDNDYYLTHSFDESYNGAGWIFLDYRNNYKELDNNTIVFGHGRKDGSMFGSLRNIYDDSWRANKDNLIINYSTLTNNYRFQIFSAYTIHDTDDYMSIAYNNELINRFIQRSAYDFNVEVNENDKILTLQTCYNESKKLVIHAKLIQ